MNNLKNYFLDNLDSSTMSVSLVRGGNSIIATANKSSFYSSKVVECDSPLEEINISDVKILDSHFVLGRKSRSGVHLFNKDLYSALDKSSEINYAYSLINKGTGLVAISGYWYDPVFGLLLDLISLADKRGDDYLYVDIHGDYYVVKNKNASIVVSSPSDLKEIISSFGVQYIFINAFLSDELSNLAIWLVGSGFFVVSTTKFKSSMDYFCYLYNNFKGIFDGNLLSVIGVNQVPLTKGGELIKFKESCEYKYWSKIVSSPPAESYVTVYKDCIYKKDKVLGSEILVDFVEPTKTNLEGVVGDIFVGDVYNNLSKQGLKTNYDLSARLMRDKKSPIDLLTKAIGVMSS